MNKPSEKPSSQKENKKTQAGKQSKDNEVREGQSGSSIYDEKNDHSAYPHSEAKDKQQKIQPEFIERNNNSKIRADIS